MSIKSIDADTLNAWLHHKKKVHVLDIRPETQRGDWFIPGSVHKDVYDKIKSGDYDSLNGLMLDKDAPVVTVCTAGRVSQKAAEILAGKGYDAYSLKDGMRGWSFAWDVASADFTNFNVIQVRRIGKGCLSYILSSGGEAVAIDASLPVEVYNHLAEENGWKLKGVIDTHIHADHLSRSRKLSSVTNTPIYLPKGSPVDYPFTPLTPGEEIHFGLIKLKVLPTPGHTLESVSLLAGGEVLFTGDTLFTDSIGRPDLKANDQQLRKKSRLLYESLQKLLSLGDNIVVMPTHTGHMINFDGSLISATIKEIKDAVSIVHLSREKFVETVADKIPPTPDNYLQIVQKNIAGEFNEAEALTLEAGGNRCSI
jgi:glyoxylase-like metal-dependent hydrolase (beta-lactamase superfamily II)/rhodanese-related sulfurtransferase